MSEELEVMKEVTSALAVEAYKDTLSPAFKTSGEIINLLPRTVMVWLGSWQKWLINGEESIRMTAEAIREKANYIPEGKLIEPAPYVAIPAIQQLSYCIDSTELRELYANLLISSMNVDTKDLVHPAFVDIIKQLSPFEAKLLADMIQSIQSHYQLLDIHTYNNNDRSVTMIATNITDVGCDDDDENGCPSAYIDNLIRLNIIEIPEDVKSTDSYEKLKNSKCVQRFISEPLLDFQSIRFINKTFRLTNFGLAFIKICCPKD